MLIRSVYLFQVCHIDMSVGSNSKETVHLIPDHILMKQRLDMHMFEINFWNLDYKNKHDGLRVLIVMKRKFVSEIMTTYFPSFLLLAITFATTFFKPFFFEAALSVNLTTMLVMTTIFISKMESLPPTSDIKMIDCWLVFCQMIPFAEVVLLTAIEYQRTEEGDEHTNTHCVEVAPINNEEVETEETGKKKWHQKMTLLIPNLKTLGKFYIRRQSTSHILSSFREEGAAIPDVGNCNNLLWSCSICRRPSLRLPSSSKSSNPYYVVHL